MKDCSFFSALSLLPKVLLYVFFLFIFIAGSHSEDEWGNIYAVY